MDGSNRESAMAFLEMVASGAVREAYAMFVGEGFRHHNPLFEGSAAALMGAMEANARQSPNKRLEVKRAIAEGEWVVTHSHVRPEPDARGAAVVHIFRFDGGRIVELWDVGQAVPEGSPNRFGMF